VFSDSSEEDIEHEAQVVSNLCVPGNGNGVVEVIRHGWFPDGPKYYYIDMEYCSETLEERVIRGVSQAEENGVGTKLQLRNMAPTLLSGTSTRNAHPSTTDRTPPVDMDEESQFRQSVAMELDWVSILNILDDIVRALVYIHENGAVHRDLKPRNGISQAPYLSNLKSCSPRRIDVGRLGTSVPLQRQRQSDSILLGIPEERQDIVHRRS
jgi:serine/threonine protein kinase